MPTHDFPFFSVPEAAVAIGITDGRLRQMIRAQEVKAHLVGDCWAIPTAEVDRLKAEPQTRGRPRKQAG